MDMSCIGRGPNKSTRIIAPGQKTDKAPGKAGVVYRGKSAKHFSKTLFYLPFKQLKQYPILFSQNLIKHSTT